MFDHALLHKKCRTSIEQLQNQTNWQIIEDALFQIPEEIKENHLESLIPPKVSTPFLIKAPQWKRYRDAAVTTAVSFKPEAEVEMIVQTQTATGKIQEEQPKSDDDITHDKLTEPLYIPEEPTNYKITTRNQRSAY